MTFKEYQLAKIKRTYESAMAQTTNLGIEGLVNMLQAECAFLTRCDNRCHWEDEIDPARANTFGMPWNEVKNLGYKKSMAEMVRDQEQCTADFVTTHEGRTYSQVYGDR